MKTIYGMAADMLSGLRGMVYDAVTRAFRRHDNQL